MFGDYDYMKTPKKTSLHKKCQSVQNDEAEHYTGQKEEGGVCWQ